MYLQYIAGFKLLLQLWSFYMDQMYPQCYDAFMKVYVTSITASC